LNKIYIQAFLFFVGGAFIFFVGGRETAVTGVQDVAGGQGLQVDRRRVGDVLLLHVDAMVLVNRFSTDD